MRIVKDVVLSPEAGDFGKGDLFLPEKLEGAKAILLIHGGGWNSMNRQRMGNVAEFLARLGYAVLNIDYRLLPKATYMDLEKDCLAAAEFLLTKDIPELKGVDRKKIIVAGASAGGHLALMAGIKTSVNKISGIIDISGPTDLTTPDIKGLLLGSAFTTGHANPEELLRDASPAKIVEDNPPPLLILHSDADKIVNVIHADIILKAWRSKGGAVQAYIYNGDAQKGHDIWRDDGSNPPKLKQDLELQIETFLRIFHASQYDRTVSPEPLNR